MRNYPHMIKNLDISPRLNTMSQDMIDKGYIVKGSLDTENSIVTFTKSDTTTETYTNPDHNANIFLPTRQKRQLQELENKFLPVFKEYQKNNHVLIVGSALMIANAILVKVPLFAVGFIYMAGIGLRDNYHLNKITKQIKEDSWFNNHEELITERLQENESLYAHLTDQSKELITKDGKITLNNIDQFPKNDLRLIRRTISKELKKDKIKIYQK